MLKFSQAFATVESETGKDEPAGLPPNRWGVDGQFFIIGNLFFTRTLPRIIYLQIGTLAVVGCCTFVGWSFGRSASLIIAIWLRDMVSFPVFLVHCLNREKSQPGRRLEKKGYHVPFWSWTPTVTAAGRMTKTGRIIVPHRTGERLCVCEYGGLCGDILLSLRGWSFFKVRENVPGMEVKKPFDVGK